MSDTALQMRGQVHGTKDARKVAIGSSVGAVIETYDFIGFGTAAALYFGHAFFPGSSPIAGTLAILRHPRGRLRGPATGRHPRRAPRRQARPQTRAGGLADRDGSGHLHHRSAAHLCRRRHPRADPAGHGAHHSGHSVRRRMGRGDPDELRARPVATKRQVHRHGAGRFPGRAAVGQPGVPGQRAPARRLGVAGAVLGQPRAGHRRPDHPRQGSRVPGVRGRQGARRHRQVPDREGDQGRLAQHRARHRPAHRRNRRLRGVDHLHDLVSEERRTGHQIRDADRAVHRLGDRHLRHHGLGPAHRQDRPAAPSTSGRARSASRSAC